ncbi:MAG TPA: N-acetylmuramoyl-L-alanine amidase [Candidatus Aquilonibacter sp.]|nr:N-acetylmuramoyl-L-alanine amidase [Candidatus Aquilonibacter sp.]
MNRIVERRPHIAKRAFPTIAGIALFFFACAIPAHAYPPSDRNEQAREQFAAAVRMRTMLEGYLEKDRSVSNYKETIAAYQKVYDISSEADEAPAALIAEAELYEEMGRLYDGKYYDTAIKTYGSLIDQYPGSEYRSAALFGIGEIEKNDQNKPLAAQATFRDFLKRYPRSEHAAEARSELKVIAANLSGKPSAPGPQPSTAETQPAQNGQQQPRAVEITDDPAVAGTVVQPRESDNTLSMVKDLRAMNGRDAARVIIALDGTIDFESARIAAPDRIYFNLSRAALGPDADGKKFDSDDGLLRSVRIAQNKPDVVRVVLDAPSAKDYNAYLLSKPYRLVIEISSRLGTLPARQVGMVIEPNTGAHSPDNAALADNTTPEPRETPVSLERSSDIPPSAAAPQSAPKPNSDGDTSLTRALGLKIHRIVIDPGHGGHDTGTIGPHGLLEKDLCLDVALRLGRMIEQKLPGAQVIYTRQTDTFIPLEERTEIANRAKADLFISIHANSSPDPTARGVETYYLNFTTSPESMEVAARENADSQESLHDLQDLIKQIARNDKVEESKDFAEDVQQSLSHKLEAVSPAERDRGVKQAPFVVLIGANMPSILAEISFVSNPSDERLLKGTAERQRIASGLYAGIANYLNSLNSLSDNKQKAISASASVADNHLEARNTSSSAADSAK